MSRETLALLPAWVFLFILPFTHTVALRLLGLLLAAMVAVWAWMRERRPDLRDLPAWPMVLFWAVLPLALAPFSVEPAYSLGEAKSEIGYGLAALLTFFVLTRSDSAARNSLRVLLCAYFVLNSWALASWLNARWWVEYAYFGGAASFSVYLVTATPMLVVAWRLRVFGSATRALLLLGTLLGLMTGLLTAQRGLWIAALAQVGLGGILLARDAGPRALRPVLVVVVAFTGLAIAAIGYAFVSRYGSDAGTGTVIVQDLRVRYWSTVIEWIAQAPLTGYGFGRGILPKAFPEEISGMGMFWHAHNVVLDYGVQLGVPGLMAILGLFGALLAYWLGTSRSDDSVVRAAGIAGALMVVGVFVRNMTNDLFQRDLALLFWALTGLLAGLVASRTKAVR